MLFLLINSHFKKAFASMFKSELKNIANDSLLKGKLEDKKVSSLLKSLFRLGNSTILAFTLSFKSLFQELTFPSATNLMFFRIHIHE